MSDEKSPTHRTGQLIIADDRVELINKPDWRKIDQRHASLVPVNEVIHTHRTRPIRPEDMEHAAAETKDEAVQHPAGTPPRVPSTSPLGALARLLRAWLQL